jgi:hypothetical protein
VRPIIAPNLGFWRQMIEWECEQSADGKSSTVHLLKGMRQLVPDVYLHRSEVVGDSLPFQERSRRAVGRPFDTPGGGGGFLASPVQHESWVNINIHPETVLDSRPLPGIDCWQ